MQLNNKTIKNIKHISLKLSLVIPCYNESSRIGFLAEGLMDFEKKVSFQELEIIILSDGSSDDSVPLLHQHLDGKLDSNTRLIVIDNKENQGKGGVLKQGVALATGDFILTMDADLAAQPHNLIQWHEYLGNKFLDDTIMVGSREHHLSDAKSPPFRKLSGLIFNFIVQFFTNIPLSDTQCGFKLYPRKIGKELFSKLENIGWAHDVELLQLAKLNHIPIIPIPLKWEHQEDSKISMLKDSINMFLASIGISVRLHLNHFIINPIKILLNKIQGEKSSIFGFLFFLTSIIIFSLFVFNPLLFQADIIQGNVEKILRPFTSFLFILFSGLGLKEFSKKWSWGFIGLMISSFYLFIFGSTELDFHEMNFYASTAFIIFQLIRFFRQLSFISIKTILWLALGNGIVNLISPSGISLTAMTISFLLISYFIKPFPYTKKSAPKPLLRLGGSVLLILLFSMLGFFIR